MTICVGSILMFKNCSTMFHCTCSFLCGDSKTDPNTKTQGARGVVFWSGLAPFRSLDRFDAVVDAFDVVRVGVHFCSDHLGHGGMTCPWGLVGLLVSSWCEDGRLVRTLSQVIKWTKDTRETCACFYIESVL